MNNFDEFTYISDLLDIYKNLLTDKQIFVMNSYYNQNLSLTEIAGELNISKNAVSDMIKHSKEKILNFEEKLGIYKKNKIIIEEINKLDISKEDKERIIGELYYGI